MAYSTKQAQKLIEEQGVFYWVYAPGREFTLELQAQVEQSILTNAPRILDPSRGQPIRVEDLFS